MDKKTLYPALLALVFIFIPFFTFAADESITVTTYYPSPYGAYREMRAQRISIGDNYVNGSQYCWEGSCTTGIDDNADLVVEGNVGIGTAEPTSKLQVVGLPVYANNASAIAGGLTPGALYRTGGDPDQVCVVH